MTELYAGFWDVLGPRGIPIGFEKLLGLRFCLYYHFDRDPRVDPLSLFACKMIRGQEETSTSQVWHNRGFSGESPTTNNLFASMSINELKSLCRVPDGISLEFSDGPTFSTVGEANNAAYFTREQFTTGLCFPFRRW